MNHASVAPSGPSLGGRFLRRAGLGPGLLASLGLAVSACASQSEAAPRVKNYVAIGDSYSSGIGIEPTADEACGRSAKNYPSLLAQALRPPEVSDVTCAGAETSALAGQQKLLTTIAPPMIDAVTAKTDLVTYSLGANDGIRFGLLIYLCAPLAATSTAPSPCSTKNPHLPDEVRTAVTDKATDAILTIREKAPKARVVVVGYPQVFDTTGCAAMPMPTGDQRWAADVNAAWNDGLAKAAQVTDADFLDVAALTQGHGPCSEDSWINPNPATASQAPQQGGGDGAPAHPTAALHAAVAAGLEELLRP